MSFANLPPPVIVAGLLGLAGILFLLQRLRVRHRRVDVVTTLFWREAVQETRARVLVRRFRHPLAYLLILAIASLLWLAVAGPERRAETGRQYVCLLDTAAEAGHGERFAVAAAALMDAVDTLPAARRRVVAAGAATRTLLAPGEEALLLEARLEGLRPDAAPSSVAKTIEALAAMAEETTVLVFSDAPFDEEWRSRLPAGFEVRRMDVASDEQRAPNRGITALGVSPAASGAWDAVDVLVEVTGDDLATQGQVELILDDQTTAPTAETKQADERTRRLVVRDVPANGQRLTARLDGGDGLTLDDLASLDLPDRPLLRVSLSPTLEAALRPVLDADPAVVIDAADADIFLARADEAVPTGKPALRFVPAATQVESFLVTYDDERTAEHVLGDVVGALGLEEIDSTGLAEATARPITLGARAGETREVAVWEELIGEGFDFVDSRSFPLFIAHSLRWLAASKDLRPWAAAGEPLDATAALSHSDGRTFDAVGVACTPPAAGDYRTSAGDALVVSLLSVEATEARPVAGQAEPTADVDDGGLDPITWLLVLALFLLIVEWVLFRAGRMP